jgi:hypothetical protein
LRSGGLGGGAALLSFGTSFGALLAGGGGAGGGGAGGGAAGAGVAGDGDVGGGGWSTLRLRGLEERPVAGLSGVGRSLFLFASDGVAAGGALGFGGGATSVRPGVFVARRSDSRLAFFAASGRGAGADRVDGFAGAGAAVGGFVRLRCRIPGCSATTRASCSRRSWFIGAVRTFLPAALSTFSTRGPSLMTVLFTTLIFVMLTV